MHASLAHFTYQSFLSSTNGKSRLPFCFNHLTLLHEFEAEVWLINVEKALPKEQQLRSEKVYLDDCLTGRVSNDKCYIILSKLGAIRTAVLRRKYLKYRASQALISRDLPRSFLAAKLGQIVAIFSRNNLPTATASPLSFNCKVVKEFHVSKITKYHQ